jgi:hypothetical protein
MAVDPTGICKRAEDATLRMVLSAPEGPRPVGSSGDGPPDRSGRCVMDTNLADDADMGSFAPATLTR